MVSALSHVVAGDEVEAGPSTVASYKRGRDAEDPAHQESSEPKVSRAYTDSPSGTITIHALVFTEQIACICNN